MVENNALLAKKPTKTKFLSLFSKQLLKMLIRSIQRHNTSHSTFIFSPVFPGAEAFFSSFCLLSPLRFFTLKS